MNYDDLFTAFYTQYRGDAQVPTGPGVTDPSQWDDEYIIGMRLANEAINRWANYDNTYWKELFSTNQTDGSGDQTISVNKADYTAPDNMKEAGGFVRLLDSDGNTKRSFQILNPEEVQFRNDSARYCYFTGSVGNGFVLHLNPTPDGDLDNLRIEYDYYTTPTIFTTGADITEMSEPYFVVHRMLANRFRISRNPYYTSAKSDAEDVLRTMQMDNNSGSWANPWSLADNSGSVWGDATYGTRLGM